MYGPYVSRISCSVKPYSEQNLFATIFTALGLDPHAEYGLPGLPTFHRVENEAAPIREILL